MVAYIKPNIPLETHNTLGAITPIQHRQPDSANLYEY
jgi:hypothetical protein